jgi:hypothetical protein
MSYVERLIIGVILVISAYTLLTGAEERHNFHLAFSQRNPPKMKFLSWSGDAWAASAASRPTDRSQWCLSSREEPL